MSDLLSLKCPHCGNGLDGANNSLVFFCTSCPRGLELEENQLTSYRLHFTKPPKELSPEAVYFPFWRIVSEYVSGGQAANGNRGERVSLVPAFFIKSINYFGDIGYYYTLKKITPVEEEKGQGWPIFPADRDLKSALAYPAIYLYREIFRDQDVEKINLQFQHREFTLLLVPFFKVNEIFVDPFILWKYPSGALV